jgi:hypothetical protein
MQQHIELLVTNLNAEVQGLKLGAHKLDRRLVLIQEVRAMLMVPVRDGAL